MSKYSICLNFLGLKMMHLHLKLLFGAAEIQKILQFDIYQKALFLILVSSANLVLKTVPSTIGQYLWRVFTFC